MKAVAVVHVRQVTDALHARVHAALVAFLPCVGVLDRGVFACDLRGTLRLLGAPDRVGGRLIALLERVGAVGAVGIAQRPFAARAIAERTAAGKVAHLGPLEEHAFLAALPLAALPLEEKVREELALLGIRDLGSFAALDRGAVLDRFGRGVALAHALARGDDTETVRGTPPRRRIAARRLWDDPLTSREQLAFALRAALDEIAAELSSDGLAALRLELRLEREGTGSTSGVEARGRRPTREERAAPPLRFERLVLPPSASASVLLRSLRWAMDEWTELGQVVGARVEATEVEPLRARQLGMFAPDGAREEEAIALARHLRARLGPGTVLRARVADPDAPLPEREAVWEEAVS